MCGRDWSSDVCSPDLWLLLGGPAHADAMLYRGAHMPSNSQTLRVAILAWEIGRVGSGLGTKIGGLGAIIEELPAELAKAARQQGLALDTEILSPCFAHYDRRQLTRLDFHPQVTLNSHTFPFVSYAHVFDDGQKA